MKQFSLLVLLFPLLLCSQNKPDTFMTSSVPVSIRWIEKIPGDFSFIGHWDYTEGVAMKEDGRPGCADGGFCPERCYGMLDTNGIVLPDSAEIFYSILDTTHYYHNISCNAWCYEWAGTDYIDVLPAQGKEIVLGTRCGIATHSSLHLRLSGDICIATIHLNSIVGKVGHQTYFCKGGYMSIDKALWQRGLIKAWFSFEFEHRENPAETMYWNGNIYKSLYEKTPEVRD